MDIEFKGFKSLKKVGLKNIARINYLIGENSSGKSSVLECFQILNAALEPGVRGGSFCIAGLTKHAIHDAGFEINITRQGKRAIKMKISANVDIRDGQVNHGFQFWRDRHG